MELFDDILVQTTSLQTKLLLAFTGSELNMFLMLHKVDGSSLLSFGYLHGTVCMYNFTLNASN